MVGLAFKASVAPFHQWTPDVYEGAPTPVTAFMAVATKAAAFGAFLRLFDVALLDASADWAPALAVLATITIVVGNVGALGQSSLKRLMAWSSVAQAGYMLAGVVVATRLGVQATVFYLGVYLMMNLAAFAVIVIRERETGPGRRHRLRPGARRPAPAAGDGDDPGHARPGGHPGHRRLHRQVLFDRRRHRRRLRVARRRHRHRLDDLAGLLPEGHRGDVDGRGAGRRDRAADAPDGPRWPAAQPRPTRPRIEPETWFVALLFGAATLFFGIVPSPLFNLAVDAGRSLTHLF